MATRVHQVRILQVDEIAPATRVFRLERPPDFSFTPGQFVSCLLDVDGETLTKPYTITSDPETSGHLDICLNRVDGGRGSTRLFDMGAGASLNVTGPWGTFTMVTAPARECVFIGIDTGIAAIRPLLHRALAAPAAPVVLWQRAESPPHLLFRTELEALALRHPTFDYHAMTDTPLLETIDQRYVHADERRDREFFICGVGEIVAKLRDRLRAAGYERRAVHYERW